MRITYTERARRGETAFTLIETVVAMAVAVLVMTGMFEGYEVVSQRSQFASYSLAANATAIKQLENIICASWVVSGVATTDIFNPVLTNPQVNALCLPSYGSNLVYATNYATVTLITNRPPYVMVRVDCVWNFMGTGVVTNSAAVLRAMNL